MIMVIYYLSIHLLLIIFPIGLSLSNWQLTQSGCNAAQDYIVQAREAAQSNIDEALLDRHIQQLKRASQLCKGAGDAYYYLSIYYQEMHRRFQREADQRYARFWREQASRFPSEAFQRNINPFQPALASSPSKLPIPSQVSAIREKYALVVGIGEYQDKRINPLKFPVKDARDFGAMLTDSAYGKFKQTNVRLLTNEAATTKGISAGLEWLIESSNKDDLVVIFMSTHGSSRDIHASGVNYFVTYDTEVDRLYSTSLPMIRLVEDVIRMVPAQRVIVFLDTCYSGGAFMTNPLANYSHAKSSSSGLSSQSPGQSPSKSIEFFSGDVPEDIARQVLQSYGRIIVTSSSANQKSWESPNLQNGIFTYYLIQALKKKKGMVTLNEVFEDLKSSVVNHVQREYNQQQTPILYAHEDYKYLNIIIGAPSSK